MVESPTSPQGPLFTTITAPVTTTISATAAGPSSAEESKDNSTSNEILNSFYFYEVSSGFMNFYCHCDSPKIKLFRSNQAKLDLTVCVSALSGNKDKRRRNFEDELRTADYLYLLSSVHIIVINQQLFAEYFWNYSQVTAVSRGFVRSRFFMGPIPQV